ncbi:MAG: glycosyltransferase [Gemmataceae bacterium]
MIAVIIPVVNQSETVGPLVRWAMSHDHVEEVIVVDAGSMDGTPGIAREAGARVVTSTFQGKGASIRDGLSAVKSKVLVFIDAYWSKLPENTIADLTQPILEGEAALTKATAPGDTRNVGLLTALPLMRTFFPELNHIEYPLSGAWAVRRSLLQKLTLEMDYGAEVGILLDVHLNAGAIQQIVVDVPPSEEAPIETLLNMAQDVTRTILSRAAANNRLRTGYVAAMGEQDKHTQGDLAHILQEAEPTDRIALFDLDGVLVRGSFILELAHHTDKGAELAEILDDPDLVGDRRANKIAALFAGVPQETFEEVAHDIPLMEGARETVAALRRDGFLVGIVSDSYQIPVEIIRCRVFADFGISHVMKFKKGKATGRINLAPAMAPAEEAGEEEIEKTDHDKENIVRQLIQETHIPRERILAVGNSEDDIGMLKAAGISVAFRPTRPGLRATAQHTVDGALFDVVLALEGEAVTLK